MTRLPLLLFPLMFVGAAVPVPEGSRRPVYYFPAQKGTRLVYERTDTGRKESSEVVEVVTAVEGGKDGARVVTLGSVGGGGREYSSSRYEVSGRGVFYLGTRYAHPLSRPRCELKLPHEKGQTWEYGDGGLKATAYGPEKVTVPAGEFDAIRVEQRDDRSPDPQITRWYAPGVGLVKLRTDALTLSLKSFTPGRD